MLFANHSKSSKIFIKHKVLAVVISSLLYPTYSLAITCNSGSCEESGNSFSEVKVSGTGTNATFTASEVDVNLPRNNANNVQVVRGGTAHFNGNLNVNAVGSNNELARSTAIQINSNGKLEVDGNFKVTGKPVDSAPGLIMMNTGTLDVKGDATITTLAGSNSGAAMYMGGNSFVNVAGKTIINHLTSSGSTMALSVQDTSKASFNELEVNANNHFTLVAGGDATLSSTGKTTITNNKEGDGIWFNGSSLISLGEDASVTAQLEANRGGIAQLNIGKDATVTINGQYADAICVLGGINPQNIITIKGVVDGSKGNAAIHSYDSGTSQENIYLQGGTIKGDIKVGKGDDAFTLQAGTLTGNSYMGDGKDSFIVQNGQMTGTVDMGAGDDYFEATGGKIISDYIYMGTGHDKAYITGGADISQLKRLTGGGVVGGATDSGELTFAKGSFSGWSLYNPTPSGVELYNWNTINLTDNTSFTATGTYLQAFDALNIDATSMLKANGNLTIGDLAQDAVTVNNSGLMTLANRNAGNLWTIKGNYSGNNGRINLDTRLGGDGSPTDKLVINGDTAGTSTVHVNNVGGLGAQTVQGIEVIEVKGNSAGEFKQDGRIVAGAYDYTLGRGDTINGTNSNNWYLTSFLSPFNPKPTVRPESGSYLTLMENQAAFNHSFHDRQQMLDNQYQTVWTRVEYRRTKAKSEGSIDNRNDQDLLQFGTDLYQNDQLHLGVMGGYVRSDINSHSRLTGYDAKGKSDGYSAGVYGTWYDQTADKGGLYVDTYALYNWFDNEVNGKGLDKEKYHSNGYTLSAETGYGFIVGQTKDTQWQIEPQAQVIYNSFNGKTHREDNGTKVRISDTDNVISRLGVRIQGKRQGFQPFVTFNYWHNSDIAQISMNESRLHSDKARDLYEVKTGGQMAINDKLTVYGQLEGALGSKSTKQYGGSLGLKYNW